MKSILLHVQDDPQIAHRIDNALAIARANGAHIEALQVVPDEALAAFESFGGIDGDGASRRAFMEGEDRLEDRVKKDLGNEDVSWEYLRIEGSAADAIIAMAALSDLIVAGRRSAAAGGRNPVKMLGDLLHGSQTPLFIRGDNGQCVDPCGSMMIAWDGSYEVANTVRNGIGMLKHASEVHVVRVSENGEEVPSGLYPLTRVLEYLSRNDIHGDYSRIARKDEGTAATLVDFALDKGCGVIAMGGYGRSRFEERLFGGVTRTMLKACPVGLLISH